MVKKLLVGATALVVVAIVLPVFALPSVDMTVDVTNVALVGSCTSDEQGRSTQTWEVALSITVRNTSEDTAVFDRTGYFTKFRDPDGSRQTANATALDPGGFTSGEQVAAGTERTFTPTVRTAIPCDATGADMFAALNVQNRDKTYLDGDTFLAGGTPVPLGPTGALGIAVLAGAVLLLAQRLGRRPTSLGTPTASR